MLRKPLSSYFSFLNIPQQLREIDPNVYDDIDSLGIYAREFRLTGKPNNPAEELSH